MNPVRVELDLDELLVSSGPEEGVSLAGLIIEKAGALALASVEAEVMREVRDSVKSITREEIRDAVAPLLDDAIAGAVTPTNSWGEPTGEVVTLRDAILKEAREQLKGKAEVRGGGRGNLSVVQEFIRQEVSKAVAEDLQTVLAEARAEVRAAVVADAAQMIEAAAARLR